MISEKQRSILAFPYSDYDALICDGAVRSGKTSVMAVAYIDWAMRNFSNQRFGICGKTVDSCVKNLVIPYMAMNYAKERYSLRWRRSDKLLEVGRGAVKNYFEVFGGKDESSYALIQGRTLAGVLLDEVALMPRSFVEQAITRCSVDGAKLWFSCNPESPQHWFYLEWIKRHRERNALHLHFEMEDNPGLSAKTIALYKSRFSGVFYQRYIQGLWVVAEGLVYADAWSDTSIVDYVPSAGEYYISVDYGTLNPFSAGLWCLTPEKAVRIREFYYSGRESKEQRTDEEYYSDLEKLAGNLPIRRVIVDPSAASFIACIRKHKRFKVQGAENDVLNGIRTTSELLKSGKLVVHQSCKDAIREFGLYRWDERSTEDKVIKENDHAMDEIRYFAQTVARKRIGKAGQASLFL